MSEIQVKDNVEYGVVCVRYRVGEMLCTEMCVCVVQGEGNIMYGDVCLIYKVREMLLSNCR